MSKLSSMSIRKRSLIAAAINIIIFVAQVLCIASFFTVGGDGNMKSVGFRMFVYFTVDSNVFCAIAALCMVPFELKMAFKPGSRVPQWALLFKFMGTMTVTLTLLVVVVFLGPISGDYFGMFEGSNMHMHLMGPLMAIFSFCFLEDYELLPKSKKLLPLSPVVIYGTTYLVMVVFIGPEKGGWYDFYHFYFNGMWYVTYAIIVAVSTAVSLIEFGLNQRRFRHVR